MIKNSFWDTPFFHSRNNLSISFKNFDEMLYIDDSCVKIKLV